MSRNKTVSVRVEAETWEEFRKFVFEKYGSLYGAVSTELNSLLKNWVAAHTNLTDKPNRLNPLGSGSERMAREIIRLIQTKIDTFQVHRAFIIRNIEEERGSDPRTVKKWFKYLQGYGHIKSLGGDMWEIV